MYVDFLVMRIWPDQTDDFCRIFVPICDIFTDMIDYDIIPYYQIWIITQHIK